MHQRDRTYARLSFIVGAIFFVSALAFDNWPTGSSLRWLSLEEARQEGRAKNKPVLIDVYADWCQPCRNMERFVFPDDSVQQILSTRYVLAKVNLDDPVMGDSVRKEYRLRAIPTYIVLTPGGRETKRHVGFFEKGGFVKWLQDTSRLFILTWQNFRKAEKVAEARKKRLLVLVTGTNENLQRLNSLFDSQYAVRLIDSAFVPTLLLRSAKQDAEIMQEIGSGKTWMDEVIVFEGDVEIGRFQITPDMFMNETSLLPKLYELGGRKTPFSPGNNLQEGKVKRIS
ncbi:MAG: thioredoxin family protein [Ignavibacteriales bacterium]|nr:thioredoxin family protein [Ignavibacteriales bacterium]